MTKTLIRNFAMLFVILFWMSLIFFFKWWIGLLKEEIQGGPEGIEMYDDWRPENDSGWIETFINKGG